MLPTLVSEDRLPLPPPPAPPPTHPFFAILVLSMSAAIAGPCGTSVHAYHGQTHQLMQVDEVADPDVDAPATDAGADAAWARLCVGKGTVNLTKASYTVGRSKACDVTIDDARVSSVHCRLTKGADGGVACADLSTNGMCVNGAPVAKKATVTLKNGDMLSLSRAAADDIATVVFVDLQRNPRKRALSPAGANGKGTAVVTPAGSAGNAAAAVDGATGGASTEAPSAKQARLDEDVEDIVSCTICREPFYKPVVLVPCMHSFCAGCYSQWMGQAAAQPGSAGPNCPDCRTRVDSCQKNHKLFKLVDAFLAENPDKRHAADHTQLLDQQDKITDEFLKAQQTRCAARARLSARQRCCVGGCPPHCIARTLCCPPRPLLCLS